MDTHTRVKARADLRDYLAEERTFLAWIRTALAVMAFGFAVAHFGTVWFGRALLLAGVAVNLSSMRRHTRVVAELNRGQVGDRGPSRPAINLAGFLALAGVGMAIYLRVA
jgi:putative membrane protein